MAAPPPQLTAFPASGHISQPLVASSVSSAEHFASQDFEKSAGTSTRPQPNNITLQPHAAPEQHICTRNFNNIFNPRLHAFPAKSTLLPSLSWSQHLLPSSSHRRISISSSVFVCILDRCLVTFRNRLLHPSTRLPPHHRRSNIDSPAILDAKFTQKQSHRYHFLKGYVPYGSTRAGGSDSAIFTSHFPRNYHTITNVCSCMCNLIMLV